MLCTSVVPHSEGSRLPSYATAELGIDDKFIQVVEQGFALFGRHVFKTDGIGWVDPERGALSHRGPAYDRMQLGVRFLVIVSDRHVLQMVFQCGLGSIRSGCAMNGIQ